MDAKAKVVPVAWQYRWAAELPDGGRANWHEASEGAYRDQTHCTMGYEYRALITLTDHEAALADLRGSHTVLQECYDELLDAHKTLISGLEALAGEVRRIQARAKRRPDDDGTDRKRNLYHVAKLLTLTNSAKDST